MGHNDVGYVKHKREDHDCNEIDPCPEFGVECDFEVNDLVR
jgi:hypothetical protein